MQCYINQDSRGEETPVTRWLRATQTELQARIPLLMFALMEIPIVVCWDGCSHSAPSSQTWSTGVHSSLSSFTALTGIMADSGSYCRSPLRWRWGVCRQGRRATLTPCGSVKTHCERFSKAVLDTKLGSLSLIMMKYWCTHTQEMLRDITQV